MEGTPQQAIERIAQLNDDLRKTGQGGDIFITQGVNALAESTQQKVVLAVQQFNDFDEDNDPYGEHDFGAVEVQGERFFFKVDYYAKNKPGYGSENPADTEVTRRVMTIMQASEY